MRLFYTAQSEARAGRWARELELVACESVPTGQPGFFLWDDGARLRLCRGNDLRGVHLRAEDVLPRASLSSELARACGVTHRHHPHVVDAMAGLGTDGLMLAALGCSVTLFERHPALWALLDDFLLANPMRHVQLRLGDSLQWLVAQDAPCCDTLYLDPMFPARTKTALPGKAMQYVRALVDDGSSADLDIGRYLRAARERVVLKRRLRDPVLRRPDWQIKGRSVRYDVYRAANGLEPRGGSGASTVSR